MPSYSYIAYDSKGEQKEGVIEADSDAAALISLKNRGYIVVKIEQVKAKKKKSRLKPLSLEQLMFFSRGLANYLKSGLPLVDALTLLANQAPSQNYKITLLTLRDQVKEGKSLASAMASTGIFRESFVGMVQAGEQGGMLVDVLLQASNLFRTEISFRRKVSGALMYPMVMLVIGVGILSFLMVYVVPKIASLFSDMGALLPLPTRILMAISSFMQNWGLYLLLALLILFLLFRYKVKGSFLMKLPYVNKVLIRLGLSLVATSLSTLLSSGIPLVKAIAIIKNITPVVSPDEWDKITKLVREGRSFSRAMEEVGVFPPDFIYMVSVGERGGDLPSSLLNIAEIYWEEAETMLNRLSNLIEPLLVVILGGAVGFVVISIVLPIFEISQLIR